MARWICENCGNEFESKYKQYVGECFCPLCKEKIEAVKAEKEYWEAKKRRLEE